MSLSPFSCGDDGVLRPVLGVVLDTDLGRIVHVVRALPREDILPDVSDVNLPPLAVKTDNLQR